MAKFKTIDDVNLREILMDWSKATTIPGILHIASSRQLSLKFMWMFCLLACMGYWIYIVTTTINKYLEYQTLTTFDIVQESSASFPVVVVCQDAHSSSSLDDEFILSCEFNGLPCKNGELEIVLTEPYGKCMAFNRGRNTIRQSKKKGPKSGLRLEMFLKPNHTSRFDGLILIITNQTESNSIYQPITSDPVYLATGTHTNLPISRQFNKRLPYPYSDCLTGPTDAVIGRNRTMIDFTTQLIGTYNRFQCIEICKRGMTPYEDTIESCDELCPTECETLVYDVVSVSSADFPSAFYAEILLQNNLVLANYAKRIESFELRHHVVSVSVFYDSDKHIRKSETPVISFDTLLANLGGQLGLFLGVSLLSFMEVVELLAWILWYLFQKSLNSV